VNTLSFAVLALLAQSPTIRTTVPLVVVPTTVTDRQGRYIDGLSSSDFQRLDNGKARRMESETVYEPISLAIAVQTNEGA
jgi:hypothetical protein